MDLDMTGEKSVFKFPKDERLHHRSLVERLFRSGKSFYEFPFRVSWMALSSEQLLKNFRDSIPENIGPLQMMVTVPKKKRRRAVDRVLMRRRIKEAYRLNRLPLRMITASSGIRTFSVALVYIHDRNLSYDVIEEKVKTVIQRLHTKIEEAER